MWQVTIRELEREDFDQVKEILPKMRFLHSQNSHLVSDLKLKETSLESYLTKILSEESQKWFVAIHNKNIIGFVKCTIQKCPSFYKELKELYIDDIVVKEEYHRQWIWSQLVNKCRDLAKNNTIKLITCKVREFNSNAQKLFQNLWFKKDYSFYSEYQE